MEFYKVIKNKKINFSVENLIKISALFIILLLTVIIRLLPLRYGAYISEFDPYIQFLQAEFIVTRVVENGFLGFTEYFQWHNNLTWHPEGVDMATRYLPGVPFAGALLHLLFMSIGMNWSLETTVIYFPIITAVISVFLVYLIGKKINGVSTGLFAALFFSLTPAFITRSSLGWYDTETVGILCLLATIFFYLSALKKENPINTYLDKYKSFEFDHSIEKISENIKHDMKSLEKHDIGINGEVFDTMLAHYLINPDINHTTEVLSENYLNYSINQKESNIDNTCEKANIIFQLKGLLEDELKLNKHISLYKEIEIPLLRVLANMEIEGINLNVPYLNKLSKSTDQEIEKTKNIIYSESKEEFNISSPKQLGEILFDKMKIAANPKKTKTGQYSTSEEILSYLAKENDFVKTILEYRSLTKLQNTYIKALPNQISKNTGKIHTEYLQTVAATGRLSSINPNLQNIPIRTERGKEIRKAFIPRNKDFVILSADYSQIELRIIAALSGEENMINAFENNEDIHTSTAALVFNTKIKNVTKMQRTNAKTVNFGIIYGVSAFGLSNQTNLSRKESKELIETYYNKYPKLKKYIASQISFAREKGYVETLLGRRRYLKDINSRNSIVRGGAERNAINAPIQGSAADIIKISMINIQSKFIERKFQSKMLLQVHDELVFDVFKPELNDVITLVKHEMENAFTLKVPLTVDIDYGENWLEAH